MDADRSGVPAAATVRAVATPRRSLGAALIVVRPSDGAPAVLPPTAATVLAAATDKDVTIAELDRVLTERFPDVDGAERRDALDTLVHELTAAGLLARR
jgi:hypothetical protein